MLSYMRQGRRFYREVVILTLPIVLQNLLTASLGLIDTFMVGVLGEVSLAAVSAANIFVFVFQLVTFGLQSGCSILISQFWGKGDMDSISGVIGIAWYSIGIISAVFTLLLTLFPLPIMSLLVNDPVLAQLAAKYICIVGWSFFFNGAASVYVGACRSMENPKFGLFVFFASTLSNIALNYILIYGKLGVSPLGVRGAAMATLFSRIIEFAIMLLHIVLSKRVPLNFLIMLHPKLALVKMFVRYSSSVVFDETMWGLGTTLYKVVMGHMEGSSTILAARALAGNVEDLCSVAIFAVASTTVLLVGRAIGRGRGSEEIYKIGATMDTVAFFGGLLFGATMIVSARTILPRLVYPMFSFSAEAAEIATMMLTFTGSFLAMRSFNSTNTVGVLRGGGDVKWAMMIDIFPVWLVALPLACSFGLLLRMSIFWVYLGIVTEQIVKFFLGLHRFRTKRWINNITKFPDQSSENNAPKVSVRETY